MSAPEAKLSYDMEINMEKKQQLYQLFLDWAIKSKVDGIVVGATFPKIISYCNKQTRKKLSIYSPGVGTQGGNAKEVISAGTDYLIVGRSILNAKNPLMLQRIFNYKVWESKAYDFDKTVFALSKVVFSIAVV